MAQERTRRADVDGLQAIAVLAVLMFDVSARWLSGGFVGIDVLFVVSGYLISSSVLADLDRGGFDLADFYRRRVRRLLPALLAVLIATFIAGWFVLFGGEYRRLGGEIVAGAAFVTNFIPRSAHGIADADILAHLWSVAILVQFALVWPVLLLLSHRHKAVPTAIVFVLVPSFIADLYWVVHDPAAAFYSPLARAWEFMIGAGLAQLQRRGWRWDAAGANTASITGCILLAAGFVLIDTWWPYPSWRPLIPGLGAALILSAGPETWLNRKLIANPAFVATGLVAYPLYLWHWPLLAFATIAGSALPSHNVRIGALGLAFLAAIATHLLIERPARRTLYSNTHTAALLALALATGMAGFACFALKGFPGTGFRDPVRQSFVDLLARQGSAIGCTEACTVRDPSRRRAVLLWGDKHAAALYAGLRHTLPADWQILQVASPGCVPVAAVDAPSAADSCHQSNWQALQIIADAKPDVVIVAQDRGQYIRLYNNIGRRLRELGVTRTLFAGPTPHWTTGLPTVVARQLWPDPPRRTFVGIDPQVRRLNNLLIDNFTTSDSMAFVDVFGTLCDDGGCLVYLGDDVKTGLTSPDDSHLSPAASDYLARQVLARMVLNSVRD